MSVKGGVSGTSGPPSSYALVISYYPVTKSIINTPEICMLSLTSKLSLVSLTILALSLSLILKVKREGD